ncbi:hypothetical protein HMPREF9333_01849 [Johnsonella ignava ATCC 51276]|uniref:Endonuclease GajA/Old nuclease/RecF-like AAA domain-containing protein n=1 Tax=Johnsonella ignava ATCC 51276 TaxID=679200 RepID=G5GJV9_9FIRM|nr:AAA family ATPase [Johnsonella ignava]EHI55002.1 hypothetical protein HMPREF9333_01849 [Johnsonella ignava ATCC 51276]
MQKLKLKKARVMNFKSVRDSGWIDFDEITTLVGVNEAGKSNILVALWKLNPAKDGAIVFSDDMPVSKFAEYRNLIKKPNFIECEFEIIANDILDKLSAKYNEEIENLRRVWISKNYDNNYEIIFRDAACKKINIQIELGIICERYNKIISQLKEEGKTEAGIKNEVLDIIKKYNDTDPVNIEIVNKFVDRLGNLKSKEMARSTIRPQVNILINELETLIIDTQRETINESEEVGKLIIDNIPKFVYYSNYGNLDSEIYLPHVIDNLKRQDLSGVTKAKARTIKVLFEYVGLDPHEILEMAPDKIRYDMYNNIIEDNEEKVAENIEKTKQRDILLQSASSKLTREFKEWWKQGNYIFRLQADGSHFRIWVSDEERPEEIVLENRSTGLQWFLSFYLVFLVESKEAHSDAIILLDEAGLSLHPLAQKDLVAFFDKLSITNQIIHTTHSPFLVDTMHLERAKVVYIDKDGFTVVSNDLRSNQKPNESKSIYAIHAALGLSVSDIFLQGCNLVIVEGVSDQYYLNSIKQYLVGHKLLHPVKDIVFIPSGGIRGINQISSLLSVKEGLPKVILDSDRSGNDFKIKLEKELYVGNEDLILNVSDITDMVESEIEDLIPVELFRKSFMKIINKVNYELDFDEVFGDNKTFNQSLEDCIDINLLTKGYKVEFSKSVSKELVKENVKIEQVYIDKWVKLFRFIEGEKN